MTMDSTVTRKFTMTQMLPEIVFANKCCPLVTGSVRVRYPCPENRFL